MLGEIPERGKNRRRGGLRTWRNHRCRCRCRRRRFYDALNRGRRKSNRRNWRERNDRRIHLHRRWRRRGHRNRRRRGGWCLEWLRGEGQPRTASAKRAVDVFSHFHFGTGAAREQRGIQPSENFAERQSDHFGIVFAAGIGEGAGRELAQFAKGNFYGAKRKLRRNGFNRQINC